MTATLLDEVRALAPLKIIDVQDGINFEEEVMRFEVYLIERALEQTGGSQLRAARLLNIKNSTLNSKIKRLHISLARIRQKNVITTNANS
jgi:transcriptional regulator with GAF, ATPase, and Fis domain